MYEWAYRWRKQFNMNKCNAQRKITEAIIHYITQSLSVQAVKEI